MNKNLDETIFNNSSVNNSNIRLKKGKTGLLFLPGDVTQIFFPNLELRAKSLFLKSYKDHLHNILQDNRIVSVMIKVCFEDNEFRNLGTQFGGVRRAACGVRCASKFSYDELSN